MKRLFMGVLIVAMVLLSCQKSNKGAAAKSASGSEPVTISYGIWDDSFKPFLEKIITSFEADNPNIKVDMQVVPWGSYWAKLQTALSGGQAWDVFWINAPYFPTYQKYGVAASLADDYRAAGVSFSDFPQALVDMYQVNGEPYTLPWFFDTVVFYYNKKRFADAGVDFPNANWTLDDVAAVGEQLTEGENKWGVYANISSQSMWGWIFSNGGEVFRDGGMKIAYTEPAAREVWQKLYDMVEMGSSPAPAVIQAGGGDSAIRSMLINGNFAMLNSGSWSYATLSKEMGDNLGVAPLPAAGPAKERKTILHGLGHIAYAKSANLAAAKKFAVYMTSPQAQEIIAKANSVMPAYQPALDIWVQNFAKPDDAEVLSDAGKAMPYPVAKTGGLDWDGRATEIIQDVFNGNIPFDAGLTQAVEEANQVIAEQ
ncbi:MAG: sugar ABC transporter substrate-binding protein [Spirochaetota bacterium]